VVAQEVCASASALSGSFPVRDLKNSMFFATAGEKSVFTVQANDVYGNAAAVLDINNSFIGIYLVFQDLPFEHKAIAAFSAVRTGEYTVSIVCTTAGKSQLHAGIARIGGLFATYYSGDIEDRIPELIGIDHMIDFSGVESHAYQWPDLSCNALCSCTAGDCCRAAFSVRWSGWVLMEYSATKTYTTQISSVDDRVRVWLDNTLVINQWSSLASTNLTFVYGFQTDRASTIIVEYKQYSSARGISLFSSTITPKAKIRYYAFYETGDVINVTFLPASVCASTSIVSGAVSLATTAMPAIIFVQAKDVYGNSVALSQSSFVVRLRSKDPDTNRRSFVGSIVDPNGWLYFLTHPGLFTFMVSIASQKGISATYYTSDDFLLSATSKQDGCIKIEQNTFGTNIGIRWLGLLKPVVASMHTFQTLLQDANARVKLWVDNILIVQEWSSLSSFAVGSILELDARLTDIFMEYKVDTASGGGVALKWKYSGQDMETIPQENLFIRSDLQGTPRDLISIQGPVGHASIAVGRALTIATAGIPATFTVMMRDNYGYVIGNSSVPLLVACNVTAFKSGGFSRRYHLIPAVGGLLAATADLDENGTTAVSYRILTAGFFKLDVRIYQRGGLIAVVYLDKYLIGAAFRTRMDSAVDFDFTSFNDLAPLPMPLLTAASTGKTIVSTRWLALVQPILAELYWIIVEVADSISLGVWVNNIPIITEYPLLYSSRSIYVGSIPTVAGDWYELAIEYAHLRGIGKIQLRWSSMNTPEVIIPSSQLYYASFAASMTPTDLRVHGSSGYCAALLSAVGNGLSVATVGFASSFAVIVR
jgi:hypothetical protein